MRSRCSTAAGLRTRALHRSETHLEVEGAEAAFGVPAEARGAHAQERAAGPSRSSDAECAAQCSAHVEAAPAVGVCAELPSQLSSPGSVCRTGDPQVAPNGDLAADPVDAGVTLVELVVAMVLFGVLSAIVVAGVAAMNGGALRITSSSDAQAGIWQAFTTLDRQVRYADAVNLPGVAAGSAWVEYRTSTPSDLTPRCYQWRYTPTTGALQTRTWPVDGAPGGTWATVLTTAPTTAPANAPATAGVQPFTTVPTTTSLPKQMLAINLTVTAGGGRGAAASALTTTFVARNSSPQSPGNADVDHNGVSDTPVCAPAGYRS